MLASLYWYSWTAVLEQRLGGGGETIGMQKLLRLYLLDLLLYIQVYSSKSLILLFTQGSILGMFHRYYNINTSPRGTSIRLWWCFLTQDFRKS